MADINKITPIMRNPDYHGPDSHYKIVSKIFREPYLTNKGKTNIATFFKAINFFFSERCGIKSFVLEKYPEIYVKGLGKFVITNKINRANAKKALKSLQNRSGSQSDPQMS